MLYAIGVINRPKGALLYLSPWDFEESISIIGQNWTVTLNFTEHEDTISRLLVLVVSDKGYHIWIIGSS